MSSYINDLIEVTGTYAAQYLPTPIADRPSTGCVLPSLTALASTLSPPSPPSDVVDVTCCPAPFIPFPIVPTPFSPPENCPSGINISGSSSLTVTSGGVPIGSPISLFSITDPVDVCHWIVSGSPTLEIGSLVTDISCPNTSTVYSDTIIQVPCGWDSDGHASVWCTAPSGLSGSGTSSTLLSGITRAAGVVVSVTGGTFSGLSPGSSGSTFTCSFSGGGGSGAIVTATYLSSSSVTWTIVNSGSNYTSAPTLTVTIGGAGGSYTANSATVTIATGCNLELNLPILTIPCYPNGPRFNGGVTFQMSDSTSVSGTIALTPDASGDNPDNLPCIYTFGNPVITIPTPNCIGGMTYMPGSTQAGIGVSINGTAIDQIVLRIPSYPYLANQQIVMSGHLYHATGSGTTSSSTSLTWGTSNVSDGGVTWNYDGSAPAQYTSVEMVSWGDYNKYLNVSPTYNCGSVLLGQIDLTIPCESGFSWPSSVHVLSPTDTGYTCTSSGSGCTATAIRTGEVITSVTLNGTYTGSGYGSGYGASPSVTISGGGGSGASAYALVGSGGSIYEIVVSSLGSGYTSLPSVMIGGCSAPVTVTPSACGFSLTNISLPVNPWPCTSGYTVNGTPVSNSNNSISIIAKDATNTTQIGPAVTVMSTPCGIALTGNLELPVCNTTYNGNYLLTASGGTLSTNTTSDISAPAAGTGVLITNSYCGVTVTGSLSGLGGGGGSSALSVSNGTTSVSSVTSLILTDSNVSGSGGVATVAPSGYVGEYNNTNAYYSGNIVRILSTDTPLTIGSYTLTPGLYGVLPGNIIPANATSQIQLPQYPEPGGALWHCLVQYCSQ